MMMFYFLIWHAIPQARGSGHFALSYFSSFGDSPGQIIKTTIFDPQKTFTIMMDPNRIDYLRRLFAPVGYLSLFSPLYLLFAIPDLLINMLSNNDQLHQIYYQYTAAITPFIFITAILGLQVIKKFTKLPALFLIFYLITMSLIGAYLFGPLPGAKEPNLDMFTKQVNDREIIEKYLSGIPKNLKVSATNNLGAHLSDREMIYTVPLGLDKADVVVLLLTNQPTQKLEQELIDKLKLSGKFDLAFEKDKFIVFKKKNIL